MFISWNALITEAVQEQHSASAAAVDSAVGESSPPDVVPLKEKTGELYESLFDIKELPANGTSDSGMVPPFNHVEFHLDRVETAPNVEEHQFITSFNARSPVHFDPEAGSLSNNLSALKNSTDEEDLLFSLRLGEREPKRQRSGGGLSTENL